MPNRNRPPEIWSIEATSLAVCIVSLDHQADAGAQFEPLGSAGRRSQRDKRVHDVVVPLGQLAAPRHRRTPRHRNVRVLGSPERVEAALLQRHRQLRRRDRIIGKKDAHAEFHGSAPPPVFEERC